MRHSVGCLMRRLRIIEFIDCPPFYPSEVCVQLDILEEGRRRGGHWIGSVSAACCLLVLS